MKPNLVAHALRTLPAFAALYLAGVLVVALVIRDPEASRLWFTFVSVACLCGWAVATEEAASRERE